MPDNFWKGKGQGVLYLHGKKSAQKLRGKHIFLEHDIDDNTILDDDNDNIVVCSSLLMVTNMTESDTARINTGLLLLSFIIGENK